MRILVISDIHGNAGVVDKALGEQKEYDAVLCLGDLTDMYNTPQGFSQTDVADIILQKILSQGKPTLCIPGNHDPYEIIGLLNEYGVNLHNNHKTIDGIKFVGFGGAATPFNTLYEPTEEETLASLTKNTTAGVVLATHMPPKETKLDMIDQGKHVGSAAIRKIILEKKPLFAASGHIHEAAGIDKLGNTVLMNPGPLFEGKYGTVDIRGKEVKCELKTTKH